MTNWWYIKDVSETDVEPIKIFDDGKGGYDINLISRKEDTQECYSLLSITFVFNWHLQVRALEDYYKKAKTSNEERLEQLDRIGHVIIPRIALSFVALFWSVGLAKFNYPELWT